MSELDKLSISSLSILAVAGFIFPLDNWKIKTAIAESSHAPIRDRITVLPIFLTWGKEILSPRIKIKNRVEDL